MRCYKVLKSVAYIAVVGVIQFTDQRWRVYELAEDCNWFVKVVIIGLYV